MIRNIIALMLTVCVCFNTALPVNAKKEELNTGFYYDIDYSDDIEPQEDDVFELKIGLSLEGSHDDLVKKAITLTVNTKEAVEEEMIQPLEPGDYYVYEINFLGTNEQILEEGFAYTNVFTVSDKEEEYYSTNLAIGKEQMDNLCQTYDDVVVVQNDELLKAIEYENNSRLSSEPDGSIDSVALNPDLDPSEEIVDQEDPKENQQNKSEVQKELKTEDEDIEDTDKPIKNKFFYLLPIMIPIILVATLVYVKKSNGRKPKVKEKK